VNRGGRSRTFDGGGAIASALWQDALPSGSPDSDPSSIIVSVTPVTEDIDGRTYNMVDIAMQNPGVSNNTGLGAMWNLGSIPDWYGNDIAAVVKQMADIVWYSMRRGASDWPANTWACLSLADAATIGAQTRTTGFGLTYNGTGYEEQLEWFAGAGWNRLVGGAPSAGGAGVYSRMSVNSKASLARKDALLIDSTSGVLQHVANGASTACDATNLWFSCGWNTAVGSPATGTMRVSAKLLARDIAGLIADGF